MSIRLDKKWFNPLYFILNDIIKDNSVRTVLVYGGKSSSKTISISQALAKECYVKGANVIAYRKESSIIPTTLKKSFNLALDSTRLSPAFDRQDRRYLCLSQGGGISEIVMKGLDDPEKAKGIESYKYVYLDELNHFAHAEFEQFNLSLRGIEGQKIFAAWNPVDENSWVKSELVDKHTFTDCDKYGKLPCDHSFVQSSEDGKIILIKTTYEDNYWIVGSDCNTYGYRDENLISEYEGLRARNYNSYKVNVLGEWGKTVFGGEFLKCWKTEIHSGVYAYNPSLAIHLFFDENVNPYFPCAFFQVADNQKSVYIIHHLAMKNPDNTIKSMCREIKRKLQEWGHKEALFIGGDATSRKEDVKQEKGHDFFRLILAELIDYKPVINLTKSNPSVRMSADFVNSILESELFGIKVRVDKSCKTAIVDFENTKEDKNGKVNKSTVTDPLTKVSYQPYGHFVDILRYFLCYNFMSEYADYQRGGNSVLISTGKGKASSNSY